MNEFDFIKKYLNPHSAKQENVVLGIGDDAAIIRPPNGMDIHVSSDILLENRHFFSNVAPEDLAHKVLAVNLSDMAAMGATPRWALLSAAFPKLDEAWLSRFCQSFFKMAEQYGLAIIGGDTTKGPLTFNLTIMGTTEKGQGLRRSGAKIGDDIWVSGELGLAAAALDHVLGKITLDDKTFGISESMRLRPTPRVALGHALLHVANSAQDISDGLGQDLNHILTASGVGATIYLDALPTRKEIKKLEKGYLYSLTGGDDYELVFTAPPHLNTQLAQLSTKLDLPLTRIGVVERDLGLRILNQANEAISFKKLGFDHFG